MNRVRFLILFSAILIPGAVLRIGKLDLRPMHHDEANQAVKFALLLETGEYRYDPMDHHGPTLYYFTLLSAWIRGQQTLAQLDERTLRIIPVLFGIGLVVLFGWLSEELGKEAILLAALFAALSPALTYYSRIYIQESIFAFFALCFVIALGKYALRPTANGALAAGLAAGLAYATKETSILVFAAAAAAWILARLSIRWSKDAHEKRVPSLPGSQGRAWTCIVHAGIGLGSALLIAFLLFSSFLSHAGGFMESFRAFADYAVRATDPGLHGHPWYFYLRLLAYSESNGWIWTECLILIPAAFAMAVAAAKGFRGQGGAQAVAGGRHEAVRTYWIRYLSFYTLGTLAAFSAIRYKTPWNLLPFYAGVILLAGIGTQALLRSSRRVWVRGSIWMVLIAGCCHLGWQNWRANYVLPSDPRNPYVYAQTSRDFLRLVRRIHDLADVHPDRSRMLVKVVCGPYEQWPLPWYLRDLDQVGYWTDPAAAGGFEDVPVVIASQENVSRINALTGDRFQSEFYGLRPDVLLTLYIERSLWERFLQSR